MKTISLILGIICLLAMLLAFIPLLGWLNWLLVPCAIIGLTIGYLFKSESSKKLFITIIFVGIFRLILGGGLF